MFVNLKKIETLTALQNMSIFFMFLYTLLRLFDISTLTLVINISSSEQYAMIGLIICLFSMKVLNKEDIRGILLGCLIVFFFLISNFNGQTNFLTIILIALGLSNRNIKIYVKAIYYATIVGISMILLLRFTGIIPDMLGLSPRGSIRYSLGFLSDRGISDNYFYFCQLFIFLKYDKLKKYWLIILLIPMLILYKVNDARATLILLILMFLMVLIAKSNNTGKTTTILYYLTNITYITSASLTILSSILYDNLSNFWVSLDNLSSGRLHLSQFFMIAFPPRMLGQKLPLGLDSSSLWLNYNKNYLMLDSGYMTMLIEAGILIFIIMTFLILFTLKKLKDSRDNISLIFWIIMGLNMIQTRPLNPTSLQVLQISKVFSKNNIRGESR